MTIEDVWKFIERQGVMVLSTNGPDGYPQAAVVEFGSFDNGLLVFNTFTDTRKYTNISLDPKVAAVIGWHADGTVQLEGEAYELKGEELARAKRAFFAKKPGAQKWEADAAVIYFAIRPVNLRFTDADAHPWHTEAFKL